MAARGEERPALHVRLDNKSYELPEKKPLPENIVKICKKHGKLIRGQCYKAMKLKSGHQVFNCKICKDESTKRVFLKNPDLKYDIQKRYRIKLYKSEKGRWASLMRKFKITKEEYQLLSEKQNHVCAICKNPETMKSRSDFKRNIPEFLSVDHCHETLKIRGLLCRKCNAALGQFKDSISLLELAINYLKITYL